MFLGLTIETWIGIAGVAATFIAHSRSGGAIPVLSPILNSILGGAPAPLAASPVVPASPSTPVLSNHPVLNDLLNLALKQYVAGQAPPSPKP